MSCQHHIASKLNCKLISFFLFVLVDKFTLVFSIYFQTKSNFVRLGEHDTYEFEDDQRVDIDIDRVELHEHYVKTPKINDIAIVYLAHDVEFTGKLTLNLFKKNSNFLYYLYLVRRIDRIRPVCLPNTKELQSRSFVGNMPFVGNYYCIRFFFLINLICSIFCL